MIATVSTIAVAILTTSFGGERKRASSSSTLMKETRNESAQEFMLSRPGGIVHPEVKSAVLNLDFACSRVFNAATDASGIS